MKRRISFAVPLLLALAGCGSVSIPFVEQIAPTEAAVATIEEQAGDVPIVAVEGDVTGDEAVPDPAEPGVDENDPDLEPSPELPPPPPPPPRPKDAYQALKYDIDQERLDLARRRAFGEPVLDEALAKLFHRLPQVIERWKGTRWSYSGTTQTPKKGAIACGYFVSTVLQHAGFVVDRVDLARQPSEQIVRTLVPDERIERFYRSSRDEVANRVEQMGNGVYIVGLDTHVGFLVNEPGKKVQFCHSTRRNRRVGVVCELASSSPSFNSKYTVVGRLGEPAMLDAWMAGAKLASARKGQPQPEVLAVSVQAPAGPTLFALSP